MKLEDYQGQLPTSVDEQVHVDHIDCGAGKDTKRRLYIKKVSANGYVFYCHHCQEKGIRYSKHSDEEFDRVANFVSSERPASQGEGLSRAHSKLEDPTHLDVVSYLRQYCLSDEDVVKAGIKQLVTKGPNEFVYCAIPIYRERGCTDMFYGQLRTVAGKEKLYRYLSYGPYQVNVYNGPFRGNGTLVITEDSISAFRVFNEAPSGLLCSLSLQGTSSSDGKLAAIVKACQDLSIDKVVLWLDDDAAGKKGQVELRKQLIPLLPKCGVEHAWQLGAKHLKEPKLYSKEELAVYLRAIESWGK